jgi:hypothetical protein
MTTLDIPRFLDTPMPRQVDGRGRLDRRIVEAVRYDYEIGLLSMAQVVRKYARVIGADAARDIMNRTTYPEVKPKRHPLGWCENWRSRK